MVSGKDPDVQQKLKADVGYVLDSAFVLSAHLPLLMETESLLILMKTEKEAKITEVAQNVFQPN